MHPWPGGHSGAGSTDSRPPDLPECNGALRDTLLLPKRVVMPLDSIYCHVPGLNNVGGGGATALKGPGGGGTQGI